MEYASTVAEVWDSIISVIVGLTTFSIFFREKVSYTIVILIAFIYILIFFLTTKINQSIAKQKGTAIDIQTQLNKFTSEFIDNSETIRLSGIQDAVYVKIKHLMVTSKNNNRRIARMNFLSAMSRIIPSVIINTVLFIYLYSIICAERSIESYFLISPVIASYISHFDSLLNIRSKCLLQSEQGKRIMRFLTIDPEISNNENTYRNILSISTKSVTYAYTPNNTISYPDLFARKPMTILIQGPSGCGKTTLIRLLSGLITPLSGTVEIDDVNNEILTPYLCKKVIGYSPQMCFLYKSSIRENITLGEDYSDEEVILALKKACAYDFVRNRPKGINTLLGINGEGLSGGEKQRISLARLLIRKPEVLFLDESFSSLDCLTAKRIYENLVKENTICFLITHHDEFINDIENISKVGLN